MNARYDAEYSLIQLIEDEAEREAARAELDAKYNAERKQAAEDYARAMQKVIAPVWEQEGIQKAGADMDELMRLFREYSTLGGAGYQDPEILKQMEKLTEGMDKDQLLSYLGVLQQVQSLMDGGMSESEIKALFPEIDFTGQLDQFAALADFAKNRSGELQGLADILNGIVPDEMKKIAVELDMAQAEARWAEFAANPGAITTDAIIGSYSDAPDATIPDKVVDALVQSYQEIDGGASTARLTPDDVVAQVSAYLEGENCSIANLKPDQIEAIVSSYAEATGVDKSALLEAFTATISAYDDAGAVMPTTKLTTKIAVTGYDLAALAAFKAANPVEVTGVVRISERYENPKDVLDDPNAKFHLDGRQITVDVVPREKITADTLFVYDGDGTMHVLVTPEIQGTAESSDKAAVALDKPGTMTTPLGDWIGSTTAQDIEAVNSQLTYLNDSLGTWQQLWGLMDGKSKEGVMNFITENLDQAEIANIQSFVQEAIAAINNGEQISDDAIAKLQSIQQMVNLLDTLGIGQNITAGIGEAMAQAGFEGDAEAVAGNLESAINSALGIASPATRMYPAGEQAAAGVGEGMKQHSFAGDAASVGANIKAALRASLNAARIRPIGLQAMSGLALGILSGQASVVSAIHQVASAAVAAAKARLQIHSPSKVFQDEVGVMMTRGMGQGALLEVKNQRKIIANAARYLTDSARDGVYGSISSDNR